MAIYSIAKNKLKHHPIRYLAYGIIGVFSLIGVTFSGVFVSMQFGLLDVRGTSSERNSFFDTLPKNSIQSAVISKTPTATSCLNKLSDGTIVPLCIWNQSPEWSVVRAGLEKDKATIKKVASQTGVSSRMIVATIVPEQLRFFTSSRESYKRFFEPLKILGSMSKFSLGVSGIKQATAVKIEQYTVDKNSPFYPDKDFSKLIQYSPGTNRGAELFNRLTAEDHYFSYLYTALYIKEIQSQWAKQGYDISDRPDVVTTLFNIGFDQSKPKATPQIGGATIWLNGESYSFGELGTAFFVSDELNTLFE